ncbi:hypothetical protein BKI52_03305 [marine bacterium AO1-C]|nr:hypothetical protein BKI52_03305 [marine bacterium AO1-C]
MYQRISITLWLVLVGLSIGYAQVPPAPTVTGGNKGQNPHNKIKRWRFGGNFSLLLGDPLLIDASPNISYNLNHKVRIGLGANYRYSFFKRNDSITQVYGGHAFGQFQPLEWLFFMGEFESLNVANAATIPTHNSESVAQRVWQFSPLLGAGIRLRLLRLLEVNVSLMRDFNYRPNISPYPSPWRFRLGFSL